MTKTEAVILGIDIYDVCKKSKNETEAINKIINLLKQEKLIKIDKENLYECKGQMSITDFPEYLPDGYEMDR